jgi:hypothetical protein
MNPADKRRRHTGQLNAAVTVRPDAPPGALYPGVGDGAIVARYGAARTPPDTPDTFGSSAIDSHQRLVTIGGGPSLTIRRYTPTGEHDVRQRDPPAYERPGNR